MVAFKLALHPIHGKSGSLSPIDSSELQVTEDIGGRMSILKHYACLVNANGDRCAETNAAPIRLVDSPSGLRAACADSSCVFELPLSLALLVGCVIESESTVGVIGYANGMHGNSVLDGSSPTLRPLGLEHIWIMNVIRRRSSSERSACAILREALESMTSRGGVLGDIIGFEVAERCLLSKPQMSIRCMRRQNDLGWTLAGKFTRAATSGVNDVSVLAEAMSLMVCQGHPNVITLRGLFFDYNHTILNDSPSWILMMDMYPLGSLHALLQRRRFHCDEDDALSVCHGVLLGLSHVHQKGIIHRDVKADNILCASDGRVVLADFGLAVHMSNRESMRGRLGTPGHIAPEILVNAGCRPESDVFSCGVVLYFCVVGKVPFDGMDLPSLLRSNALAKIGFPAHCGVHKRTRKLVRLMVRRNPEKRPDTEGALRKLHMMCAARGKILSKLSDSMLGGRNPEMEQKGEEDEEEHERGDEGEEYPLALEVAPASCEKSEMSRASATAIPYVEQPSNAPNQIFTPTLDGGTERDTDVEHENPMVFPSGAWEDWLSSATTNASNSDRRRTWFKRLFSRVSIPTRGRQSKSSDGTFNAPVPSPFVSEDSPKRKGWTFASKVVSHMLRKRDRRSVVPCSEDGDVLT